MSCPQGLSTETNCWGSGACPWTPSGRVWRPLGFALGVSTPGVPTHRGWGGPGGRGPKLTVIN